ncbi:MAG: hypothetical protein COV10_04755 [Candidatus Vogelbacteria bacterium CG10_big_fil_rev_8_21_14_0_10_51_16]|uniref:AI-2E family transporter n=1 Tax=Candidatus Vogelbacteria bacterium CG10_big_fil_rev_8_21_14_0_10_51_16 TaxID=1975045 RepID=A0A2H0RDA1_9BACT|nr:MAG: hypothetical protein COV10_04755 [Candidatus Vogelbacteria bacterium CG10_big_fil_rev_8_21_14_0_10_51_16]
MLEYKREKDLTIITTGTLVRAALVIVTLVAAYLLRDLILVILTSVVIASAIEPMVASITRRRVHRTIAVLFIYAGVIVFLGVLLFVFLPPLIADLSQLSAVLPQLADDPGILQPFFNTFPGIPEALRGGFQVVDLLPGATELATGISGGVAATAGFLFFGLFQFVLTIVLSFYLSVQRDGVESFLRLVTAQKHESYVLDLWERARRKIGLWMQGQLLLALFIGVFVYLGLAIFNIKYALLLAILAAVFEIIPVFGPILAAIPGVAVGFTYGITTGFFVLAFYIIIQQFENHLIYPLVVRKITGIPPLLVILALVAGAQLFGFLGLILAVPLATVFVEVMNDYERKKRQRPETV